MPDSLLRSLTIRHPIKLLEQLEQMHCRLRLYVTYLFIAGQAPLACRLTLDSLSKPCQPQILLLVELLGFEPTPQPSGAVCLPSTESLIQSIALASSSIALPPQSQII